MPAIASPCIQVCVMDTDRLICLGCGRNPDEIAAWSSLSDPERTRVMADLPRRLAIVLAPQPATPSAS